MKICLIVDNPIRDLPSSLFLAKKLKDKKVFLINFYQFFEILLINPDIVILNHVRAVYWPIIKILKKKKIKVLILDQEGAYFGPDIKHKYQKYLKNIINLNKYYDYFFLWGKYLNNILNKIEPSKNIKSQFILSGHPRVDVLKQSQIHNSKNINYDFLINLNNNAINSKFENFNYDKYLLSDIKNDIENIDIRERKNRFRSSVKLIKYILKCGHSIIIRPHPYENIKLYKKIFTKYKNIYFSQNRHFIEDIREVKYSVSFWCQTIFDSTLLNKKNILISFNHNEFKYHSCPIRSTTSFDIDSRKKFYFFFKNIKKIKFQKSSKISLKEIYYNLNFNSSNLIDSLINNLKFNDKEDCEIFDFIKFFFQTDFKLKLRIFFLIFMSLDKYLLIKSYLLKKDNHHKVFDINSIGYIDKIYQLKLDKNKITYIKNENYRINLIKFSKTIVFN